MKKSTTKALKSTSRKAVKLPKNKVETPKKKKGVKHKEQKIHVGCCGMCDLESHSCDQ